MCPNRRIWSQLLKKSLMGNFIFCAVLFLYFKHIEKLLKAIIKQMSYVIQYL